MDTRTNEFDQAIGAALPGWTARRAPEPVTLTGRHCRLEPLDAARHADDLHAAYVQASDGRDWTYLTVGPFDDPAAWRRHVEAAARGGDPRHYAVVDLRDGRAVGTLALMRQEPTHGVVEVGHVTFSPRLQRTPISTEAQALLMAYVFDELGYRRYEWKCDSLNARSRRTAERLGFRHEGVFRQALVYKGRSRDTAWHSVIDAEWPLLRAAFAAWLAPENFDADGRQRASLQALRDRLAAA